MKASELTDEKIGALIDSKTADAISWYSSKLSRERQLVTDYIEGRMPKAPASGSRWVDSTCGVAFDQMTAQLRQTFRKGSGIVTFDAEHAQDIEAARIASEYANHVFYKQNPGEDILTTVIQDGLTARIGVAKVWWEKEPKEEEREFDAVSEQDLQAWMDDDSIIDLVVSQNPDGSYAGKLVRSIDCGKVKIEAINPEEFAVEQNAKRLDNDTFCVHRTVRTLNWIYDQFPEMKKYEDELRAGQGDDLSMTPEVQSRFRDTSDGTHLFRQPVQDELTDVIVIEAYCRFKRKGDLSARLYKVLRCGNVNIEIKPVTELPFVVFTPIPKQHAFYGRNYIKTLMPTQDLLTAISRQGANHLMITNNPRYFVEKGGLVNPRELLDNRLGGIVNVKNMTSVMPMQHPNLNPAVFSMADTIRRQAEAISGISAASVGMNTDVISKQNSAELMEQQTGNSQTRQKEIAHNFVSQFLCPLFTKINKLVVQFEKNEKIVAIAGNYVVVNPWTWLEDRAATASAHLGFGEKESQARKIAEFFVALKQNGGDVFTGYEGFYNGLSDMLTLEGRRVDIPRYLPITPDKVQPKADPKLEAEVAKLQAEAQVIPLNAETARKKVDEHGIIAAQKLEIQRLQQQIAGMKEDREQERKDLDVANRIDVAQREMHLLENPPAETEQRGIISP